MRALASRFGGRTKDKLWSALRDGGDNVEQVKTLLGPEPPHIFANSERNFEHEGTDWGAVSALFAAITMEQQKVAIFFIKQPGAELRGCYSSQRLTVLHQAARLGQQLVVTALLQCSLPGLVEAQDSYHRTALHMAAEYAKSTVVLDLLTSGAIVDSPDIDGLTPLHLLVLNADQNEECVFDTAKYLLYHGADPNSEDRCGDRPIHDVARLEAVKDSFKGRLGSLLHEHGADLFAANEAGETLVTLLKRNKKGDKELTLSDLTSARGSRQDLKPVCGPRREKTCHEFQVHIQLFKGGERVQLSRTVYDLVYNEEPNQENDDTDLPDWRWIHFPANNIVWIQDYVWRLTDSWRDDDGTRKRVAREQLKESTMKRKQTSPNSWIRDPGVNVWPIKGQAAAESGLLDKGPEPDPRGNVGRCGSDGSSEQEANSRNGGSDVPMLSIVIPFLDFEGEDFLNYRDKIAQEQAEGISGSPPRVADKLPKGISKLPPHDKRREKFEKMVRLLDCYPMLKKQDGVQKLETLDEFYYDVLTLEDLRQRDHDQVVWRWFNLRTEDKAMKDQCPKPKDTLIASRIPRKKGDTRKETPKVLVVHQLWIWKLDSRTVITALPERWHTGRENTLLDLMRRTCTGAKDADTFIESALAECVCFFNQFNQVDRGEGILDIFGGYIALEAHAELRCFSGLYRYLDKSRSKKYFGGGANDWKPTAKISPDEDSEAVDSMSIAGAGDRKPTANTSLGVDSKAVDPMSITEEFRIANNLKDITDELRTISQMLSIEKGVVNDYFRTLPQDARGSFNTFLEKWSVNSQIGKIKEMTGEATQILRDLDYVIQTKQATIASYEAAKSYRLNAYIVAFTIVTIIFAPLSFMTSLFALQIDWFPRDENGELNYESHWITRRMFAGELAALAIIILIAIAIDWLQRASSWRTASLGPYLKLSAAWRRDQQSARAEWNFMGVFRRRTWDNLNAEGEKRGIEDKA